MILIQFTNDSRKFQVEYSNISEHVCQCLGSIPLNRSGFLTFSARTGEQLGDRSDFTIIYRTLENGYQYSNDGSVWEEPVAQADEGQTIEEPVITDADEPTPSPLDRIEAQVLYTALMTDTLLEAEV